MQWNGFSKCSLQRTGVHRFIYFDDVKMWHAILISLFLWLYHVNILFQDPVIPIRVKMEDDAKILMALARVLAYVGVLETTVKYVVVCLDEILQ